MPISNPITRPASDAPELQPFLPELLAWGLSEGDLFAIADGIYLEID
jgi:hypothetical protein